MRTRLLKCTAALLIALMFLTACGGGGSTSSDTGENLSQGVTDTTILVGTCSLVSGAYAFIGQPAYDGLRATVARFNAKGGVRGRTIELIAVDDQYDAALGKAMVEQFVEQDKVFAMCSLLGNIVEPCLDYIIEKGIPTINISSGLDPCYRESDSSFNLFQVQPASMTDARYLISRTIHESLFGPNKDEKLPADAKIAVVHGTDSATLTQLGHLIEQAKVEGCDDRLVTEGVTAETYATAIQKFKNENCAAVIFLGITSEAWIAAMDDAQWEVPYIGAYGTSTLQSYAPETYKPGRPIYATVWGDYGSQGGTGHARRHGRRAVLPRRHRRGHPRVLPRQQLLRGGLRLRHDPDDGVRALRRPPRTRPQLGRLHEDHGTRAV